MQCRFRNLAEGMLTQDLAYRRLSRHSIFGHRVDGGPREPNCYHVRQSS